MRTSVFAVVLLAISFHAFAQGISAPPPPPPPMTEEPVTGIGQDIVIVSGNATVDMKPDQVSFNLGVATSGTDIRAIVAENNTKVTRVLTALKDRGVKSEELQTSSFVLHALRDEGEEKDGYRVSNEIGVTRAGTSDAGDLIAAAIEAGANGVRGPQFDVRNEKSVQSRCLELAFSDARRKASKLATLSSRRLGKVLAVTDGSSSPFELKYRAGIEGGVVGGVTFESGLHPVECGVTVAFRLIDE